MIDLNEISICQYDECEVVLGEKTLLEISSIKGKISCL